MGRWGDGEMGRWGDGEMGRWGKFPIFQLFNRKSKIQNLKWIDLSGQNTDRDRLKSLVHQVNPAAA